MTTEDFLNQFVDGYLLGDLQSMADIPPKPGYGNVGYPLVLSTLTGCELIGGLLSDSTWTHRSRDARKHFAYFWNSHLYPGRDSELAGALYQLLRNGIAHCFAAKPFILAGC
jgi:hypothetical protein